jgi:hypothetical protein
MILYAKSGLMKVCIGMGVYSPMPEFIDPVFTKTSPKLSFSVIQNERFGLVFAKTGSIISGTIFLAGFSTLMYCIMRTRHDAYSGIYCIYPFMASKAPGQTEHDSPIQYFLYILQESTTPSLNA